jgi:hypothetical protein
MHYTYYASDLLEAAMELAQSKALNSYSFRDCMNWLTELWQQCYERIAQVDSGFYSKSTRITQKLTTMPPFVKNTVRIYAGRDYNDEWRKPYKESSMNDLTAAGTFHISGRDLYVPDAEFRTIWCEYVPEPPFITFTKNNRDPKILTSRPKSNAYILDGIRKVEGDTRYGSYELSGNGTAESPLIMTNKYDTSITIDVTVLFEREFQQLQTLILAYPYVFVSYKDTATGDWSSYIMKNVLDDASSIRFNPFDYQGPPSRVRYVTVKWNDYTGMGAVIEDQNDLDSNDIPKIKELGFTPDTIMWYPSPIMRNYMVAHLAKKFADINSASIMAVDSEVASADYSLNNFLQIDKSGIFRFDKTVGPTLGDLL